MPPPTFMAISRLAREVRRFLSQYFDMMIRPAKFGTQLDLNDTSQFHRAWRQLAMATAFSLGTLFVMKKISELIQAQPSLGKAIGISSINVWTVPDPVVTILLILMIVPMSALLFVAILLISRKKPSYRGLFGFVCNWWSAIFMSMALLIVSFTLFFIIFAQLDLDYSAFDLSSFHFSNIFTYFPEYFLMTIMMLFLYYLFLGSLLIFPVIWIKAGARLNYFQSIVAIIFVWLAIAPFTPYLRDIREYLSWIFS